MGSRVCADETAAAEALASGERVVLIVVPGASAPALGDPAHLAFLVGDAADPAVREAAEAMAADLWPGNPVSGGKDQARPDR
jgi:hypothetical protein